MKNNIECPNQEEHNNPAFPDTCSLCKSNEEICLGCQRPLIRNNEDWTCKECESKGRSNLCEECCMRSIL